MARSKSPKPLRLTIATFLIIAKYAIMIDLGRQVRMRVIMLENRFMHFCKRNVWNLLAAVFCLSALVYFVDQHFSHSTKATAKDFIAAKALFERISARECLSKESLESACTLINKHPELAAQYQGVLSLALAQGGFIAASEDYAKSHMERIVSLSSPFHKEFTATGFLIAQNQYDEALQKALALEENLQNEPSYPRLRVFNLMRIAFLAHETKKNECSKKAFEVVSTSPFSSDIQSFFSEGSFTLNDFFH